jgi:hypothetical protein
MADDELNLTPKEIIAKACEAYGVKTIQDLKKTKEFNTAFTTFKDTGVVLKKGLRYKMKQVEGVPAFFIDNAPNRQFDKTTRKTTVVGHQPRVLLADSTVLTLWGAPPLDGAGVMQRISAGPVNIREDIYLGTEDVVVIPKTTKAMPHDHDAMVPDVSIGGAVERAKNTRSIGADARGTMFGESGKNMVFATLTIGEREDVSFFGPGGFSKVPVLKSIARDARGVAMSLKLPIDQVCETFNIQFNMGEEDSIRQMREEFRDVLHGEPIAVYGKLGLFHPKSVKDFDEGVATEAIADLSAKGLIRETRQTAPDATKLKALVLKDYTVERPDGTVEQPLFVRIGNYNVYDIVEEVDKDTGRREWKFMVLATEQGKTPWMDCVEHHYTTKAGEHRVNNEGAFVVFLNQIGGRRLAEDDPFALAAKQLDLEEFGATPAAPLTDPTKI